MRTPYVMNCMIKMKSEDYGSGLPLFDDGKAYLDGYAIIPRKEYEEMVSELASYRKLESTVVEHTEGEKE